MTNQIPKIALITGGSRGLGRNTAESLARKGVDLVVTYNSRADEARKVVAAIQAQGRKAAALQLDTGAVETFPQFVGTLKRTLKEIWGREQFDFLVNNAGISHHNSIEKTTEAELDALYNVHFKGGAVEVLTRYLARELGSRRIVANVVAPGPIATDFSGGMVRDNPELNKHIADMTALGRAGLPGDIGPMIASLLSDDNRWINAQRIEVSGGMSI